MAGTAPTTSGSHHLAAVGAVARPALCRLLVECGKLDANDVERALRLQREQEDWARVGSLLVKLGLVSERDVTECLSGQLGMRLVEKVDFPDEPPADDRIAARFLKASKALVIEDSDAALTVVMADPLDDFVLDALNLCCGKPVLPCIGIPSEIDATLGQWYDDARRNDAEQGSAAAQYVDDVEQLKELAGEAPVIKLVNQLIQRGAEAGASDIHIEPFESELKVRYRIDGLLREIEAPPVQAAAAVISRIKIMASLNIAERRLAQDGRFRQRVRGVEYDLRVSTLPTMFGESVVLRLLKRDAMAMDFGTLGFSRVQQKELEGVLERPHGILLVTGPTGSGKSTTLYAALKHLHQPERMIVTVEDPIEYNLPGINQMQVKPQIGLTFANALRSIVRQDPDVIMIGEMRDSETAQIAVQSALTGHLVLSTLHTNDAPGSVMRLLDMGVQDYLVTSAVIAIQAQRLVRTLCKECREPYTPIDEIVDRMALDRFTGCRPPTLYRAVGCERCGHTGYAGRRAILEILTMSDEIRERVLKRCDVGDIARAAVDQGMVPMRDDGLIKALAGETSIEEVMRVTPEQPQ